MGEYICEHNLYKLGYSGAISSSGHRSESDRSGGAYNKVFAGKMYQKVLMPKAIDDYRVFDLLTYASANNKVCYF